MENGEYFSPASLPLLLSRAAKSLEMEGEVDRWLELKHPCGCKCGWVANHSNFDHVTMGGAAIAINMGTRLKCHLFSTVITSEENVFN